MKSNYKQLGQFIRQVDVRNASGKEENLLGVSVQKTFIPSIANTVGTDFTKYKVVRRGQFTYIPDTSRRGDKIGIALLSDCDEGLVSNVYTTFEVIDKNELLPEYLMLWFSRPEFDRYARFKSHGSVREVMDWDEMCKVQLPVPPISVQRDIVKAYQTITNRIALKQQVNDNLEAVLAASHSKMFFSKDTSEHSKLGELMTFGNGKSRPKTDGPIPVYGGNGVLSYTDHHNIENAVLIGRVGAYCGSVYLEQGICWVSDNAIFAKSKITKDIPDKHGLYDVVQILFGGLSVLLVKREEDEREHDHHHQHCRRRQVEMCLRQKENRDTDRRSNRKTNELPLGQVEHDLRFDAVKILRDRNKCH